MKVNSQKLVDRALRLKAKVEKINAKYEKRKKAFFEKHKEITTLIKGLVTPLETEIESIKAAILDANRGPNNVVYTSQLETLEGVTVRQAKYDVVGVVFEELFEAAIERPELRKYLMVNMKTIADTVKVAEEFHNIPGVVAERGDPVIALTGQKAE